ncbi:MAG TPA: ATP-binding protein [candidate division Zixibacteria bacterium]|nr:ATP-binding protein [candidate division Zixibacteria bacterium]
MSKKNTNIINHDPFRTGAVAGKYFVGREKEIESVLTHLDGLKASSPNHFYITGLHGSGKSSFLEKIAAAARGRNIVASYLVLMDTPTTDLIQWKSIMGEMIKSLAERIHKVKVTNSNLIDDWESGTGSIFRLPKATEVSNAILFDDFTTISDLMKDNGLEGLVICFDEGQWINPSVLSALKNVLQRLDCFLVVLSLRLVSDSGGIVAAGRAALDKIAQSAGGDSGASRFFADGVAIGPFSSNQEAVACIEKRLENNEIQFEQGVIERICHITGGVPREMISLASKTWNLAKSEKITLANPGLLQRAFCEHPDYSSYVIESRSLFEGISIDARKHLGGLLKRRGTATAEEIAEQIYPILDSDIKKTLSIAIEANLSRLCIQAPILLTQNQTHFIVLSPACSFALLIAMGEF